MEILWRIIAIQITEVQNGAEYRDNRAHFNPGDCLIIFGPSKLPEIGRAFGNTLKEFKKATRDLANGAEENEETKNVKEKAHLKAIETKESKTVN